ncbi:hypothetical protein DMN91_001866 [Ooceraea biroi]|uniref:Hexosyltransferase n=1 Tax=Ooceraea biroi TaxID=2015173 RepID=A0A026WKN0_OOCBI|nr:beta-1,3-galactosyltransferase 5 [Ooceraea biroi]EZA56538.1 Beta-1,3-galactosyltransferase [Ooceraea biroi]RLU25709.1 hypothetical protein DMN91_001866 [Ooceraea biroi]
MLSKFGFLLLLACVTCVLLFVTLAERTLRPQSSEANLVHFQALNEVLTKSSSSTRVIIEPSCNATFLTWIVTSYAGDASARSALRRAYAAEELRALEIRRVFLLGTLDADAERKTHVTQSALVDESRRFGDILQGDFLDTYRNLTRKHLMGLRWAVSNCRSVRYIMKMDDDIVVNLYGVLDKLHTVEENSLAGYVLKNMAPVREPANKWYVSRAEYTGSVYPAFVSGWLYVTRPRVASRLIDHAESSSKHFWIDDVFVTGILRQALNVRVQNISEVYTTDYRYLECCMKGRESLLKCEFLIGPNGGDVELQVRFREFARFCHANCSARAEGNFVGRTCVVPYREPNLPREGAVQISPIRIL